MLDKRKQWKWQLFLFDQNTQFFAQLSWYFGGEHSPTPSYHGQWQVFLTIFFVFSSSESWFLATVWDNSVRYQAITVMDYFLTDQWPCSLPLASKQKVELLGLCWNDKRCWSFNLRGCSSDKSHRQSLSSSAETVFHAKIISHSRFKSSLLSELRTP